jgi:hypothetical protein
MEKQHDFSGLAEVTEEEFLKKSSEGPIKFLQRGTITIDEDEAGVKNLEVYAVCILKAKSWEKYLVYGKEIEGDFVKEQRKIKIASINYKPIMPYGSFVCPCKSGF